MSYMFKEALDLVFALKLQLKAMQAGVPISDGMAKKELMARYAFLALDEYNDKFSKGAVIRGLR